MRKLTRRHSTSTSTAKPVLVGIAELHTGETKAISDGEKASTLNYFFASVFTNENDNIPACERPTVDTPCADMRLTR